MSSDDQTSDASPRPESESPQPASPSQPADSLQVAESSNAQAATPETPETPETASAANETAAADATADKPSKPGGLARGSGPLAARGLGIAKPASPSVDVSKLDAAKSGGKPAKAKGNKKSRSAPRPKLAGEKRGGEKPAEAVRGEADAGAATVPGASAAKGAPIPKPKRGRVAVPNRRSNLDDDLQAELDATLAAADMDDLLGEAVAMTDHARTLSDGTRVHAMVLKIHEDSVFVSLGGPNEGTVPFEQFETEPAAGDSVEVVVRGFTSEDGLYQCTLPGGSVEVSDWDDLQEGSVVEATITATNNGGLEAKVGGVKGFIPISQISEYRVEDTSEFVDQKFLCVVTEANARRGNLVLSRRAVLEREREEKKREQLAKIEAGDLIEGTVRSVKDFGAFVDLGGLDGLIHVSKLSWERIKHPSEVLEEGQKVKVKIDKVDKESGKIALSYRDLLENPWDAAESQFGPGSVHVGTVSRIAPFGCFVRLAAGVEGLVHISEIANHRVSKVDAMLSEGESVEVKVLTFDRDAQKIALSIKQAQKTSAPVDAKPVEDTPPPEVAVKPQHAGPLRGGNDRDTGGERFGLRW